VNQRIVNIDYPDLTLLIFLEDEASSEEDSECHKVNYIFRNRETKGV